ncbi:Rieske 2Fe-2S domain-containing protein [uncultured Aquitalea sp.]|uniref:Rieske (2Fe-2S) protein n=1 Tax=uncultured Aquitalea sp. TaxID=540272 RepID=UPI0025E01641|nr:Rieske 2Fe-2S domain-containing protein [uncultured Aquitalea sp.]
MAAAARRLICPSANLVDGHRAFRFDVTNSQGQTQAALALRYQGRVYAYLNACRHIPVELDWQQDGNVFDISGQYLVCSMHGAIYRPDNGVCAGGPCRGQKLVSLPVHEEDGQVWLNVIEE